MSHTITCRINRNASTTNPGQNGDRGFQLNLSEMNKDKQGNKTYTNYQATVWAKAGPQDQFYVNALVEGSIVTVSCDKLAIRPWDSNGKSGISLDMIKARLDNVYTMESSNGQAQQQQAPAQKQRAPQQQNQNYQQPQQNYQQQQNQGNQQPQQPTGFDDFDDDLAF